ncbi:hypothetical protein Vadar_024951 [Vaccinium darrowii]|uniref:Uncharacterized protein n=1 Tax=Vaccinium darrowii TaxID=229202 RepID=A0ACB7YPW1_9ERIC|nr:hypothetical protein Vadar_024951 [Vaccinium darrowii]
MESQITLLVITYSRGCPLISVFLYHRNVDRNRILLFPIVLNLDIYSTLLDIYSHHRSRQSAPPTPLLEFGSDQGNRTTPSYVAFTDTECLIGDAAKNQIDDENEFDMDNLMDETAEFDLPDNIDLEMENDDEVAEKTENEAKKVIFKGEMDNNTNDNIVKMPCELDELQMQ